MKKIFVHPKDNNIYLYDAELADVYCAHCDYQSGRIPTLEQDRSTWLEISERCDGKLELGKHFKISTLNLPDQLNTELAIPTPQNTEDEVWEEARTKFIENDTTGAGKAFESVIKEFTYYLKQHYTITRKS